MNYNRLNSTLSISRCYEQGGKLNTSSLDANNIRCSLMLEMLKHADVQDLCNTFASYVGERQCGLRVFKELSILVCWPFKL